MESHIAINTTVKILPWEKNPCIFHDLEACTKILTDEIQMYMPIFPHTFQGNVT